FSVVVLPQPEGPSTAVSAPLANSTVISFTATVLPKAFRTFWSRTLCMSEDGGQKTEDGRRSTELATAPTPAQSVLRCPSSVVRSREERSTRATRLDFLAYTQTLRARCCTPHRLAAGAASDDHDEVLRLTQDGYWRIVVALVDPDREERSLRLAAVLDQAPG